ncbi:hypothetical protein HS99_0000890 [Kitasatospora aureofaciens]|uniref:Uncharacterized protein n=1 Tax=Kitasatospora aureofaciens TaxID=1894 RepID=A0A1E7NF47_KITAU|nr:hypothetical protein [Kitasatospora aureofaciens]OEV39302.1 hypothetical protein HS99_0000890 [Kitasatospora aureofaciens]
MVGEEAGEAPALRGPVVGGDVEAAARQQVDHPVGRPAVAEDVDGEPPRRPVRHDQAVVTGPEGQGRRLTAAQCRPQPSDEVPVHRCPSRAAHSQRRTV